MTTTEQANKIISTGVFNKRGLSEELGITRPTLDTKLTGNSEWKKLEIKWINKLYTEKS